MDDEKKPVTWEEAKAMLEAEYPHGIELVSVSYDDKLTDEQVKILLEGKELWEDGHYDSWVNDAQWDTVEEAMKSLFDEYDTSEIEDEIRDWLYDHDTSTVEKDLMRHTPEQVMYYRLGVEIDGYDEHKDKMRAIKKIFKPKDEKTLADLDLMVRQGHAGDLVIMFRLEMTDLKALEGKKFITFTDPTVAVMDRWNGAGDFTQISGTYQVPCEMSMIRGDEQAGGYALISDVFGCTQDAVQGEWNSTDKRKGVLIKVEAEGKTRAEKLEEEYEKKFKEGGCTHGDMKMSRHRDAYYENNYPCGTHCPHCKNFWID